MSNSKVRKALEQRANEMKAQSNANKIYSEYKKKESLLINYQICKSYFNDQSASVLGIIEKILKTKFKSPKHEIFIRKAAIAARGKTDATISIPRLNYENKVNNILSKFVKDNFAKIMVHKKTHVGYPFILRDLEEKYS